MAPAPRSSALDAVFGLDPRSLALFRVGAAGVILLDLWIRAASLGAHYTDAGVLPRADHLALTYLPGSYSLHMGAGGVFGIGLLFLLQAAAALLLLVGWRTRAMTALSWFLLASLHSRNGLVLNSGDFLLRLLLFWAIFLPLGACASVDAAGEAGCRRRPEVSVAGAAFILQLGAMYVFSALLKTHPRWWNGQALYFALHADVFATPFGVWIRQFEGLLAVLTHLTIWSELLAPFLLLVPWRTATIRLVVAAGFVALHVGISSCMNVGIFSLVCVVAWSALLPPVVWDALADRAGPRATRRWEGVRARLSQLGHALAARTGVLPAGAPGPLPRATTGFLVACLVVAGAWNVRTLDFERGARWFPRRWNHLAYMLRLDQYWAMFAPGPMTGDGWWVIPAKLADGSTVDLFRAGRPVSWAKPASIWAEIPDRRWGKYLMNIREDGMGRHRGLFARWLARRWDATHPPEKRIERVLLYFMREVTTEEGPRRPKKVFLWQYTTRLGKARLDAANAARKAREAPEPKATTAPEEDDPVAAVVRRARLELMRRRAGTSR